MIQSFVDGLVQLLQATNMSNWFIVLLISFLPFSESRLGIPIGIRLGLTDFQSWLFAFVGSSLAIPFVLILCVPLLDRMAKTKSLKWLAKFFNGNFEDHAKKLDANNKKKAFKKMLGVAIFVALPGPLTGVWAGTAVASILKLSFANSIISVAFGNIFASLLVLVFSDMFAQYIDIFIFVLLVLTALAIIMLAFRMIKKVVKSS